MSKQLLLVEDDEAIADVVKLNLIDAGFSVQHESDGSAALRSIGTQRFDLVLLDLMLPGTDGWDLCKHLRALPDYVPLIIISARTAEAHRVLGLELGADDYLAKPFSVLELVARVRALLRRAERLREAAPAAPQLRFGDCSLDPLRREVWRGNAVIALTLREFDLLYFLARHPGEVFNRGELLNQVWGSGFDGYEHTVNSHINRLRTKLEADARSPKWIQTVWGVGYRFGDETRKPAP
ncbi:MAG: response regulator transcription factor [Betaproteobacteria bacterium]|nr:response regulator transcription factor [Betaproteobacteria bacterium]